MLVVLADNMIRVLLLSAVMAAFSISVHAEPANYLVVLTCTPNNGPCTSDIAVNRTASPMTLDSCITHLKRDASLQSAAGSSIRAWCSQNIDSTAPGN